MSWERVTDDGRLAEWERSDGNATIRLRQRPDGGWAVRFDRVYQAPDGAEYRHATVDGHDEAMELIEELQSSFDVSDA